MVHIAPLDGDHKLTGRLTGYGKTIDIRYRPTDEQLFSSTKSHEHHENSQHPYDMESSNFKDHDCLYKGMDLSPITDSNFWSISGIHASEPVGDRPVLGPTGSWILGPDHGPNKL